MLDLVYPYILKIHIATVIVLVGLILYTDSYGMQWVRGKVPTLNSKKVRDLHRYVWCGLIIMLTTGPILFMPFKEYLLYLPAFWIKMSFIAILIINAFIIGKIMHVATEQPFASLSKKEKIPLIISGVISTISWVGAFIAANMLGLS